MPVWKTEIRERLVGLQLTPMREAAVVEELAQHLEDCYAEWLANTRLLSGTLYAVSPTDPVTFAGFRCCWQRWRWRPVICPLGAQPKSTG